MLHSYLYLLRSTVEDICCVYVHVFCPIPPLALFSAGRSACLCGSITKWPDPGGEKGGGIRRTLAALGKPNEWIIVGQTRSHFCVLLTHKTIMRSISSCS